jgi:hypothetical protein
LNTNQVIIHFRASDFNGYPNLRIWLDGQILVDHSCCNDHWTYEFELDQNIATRCLQIERYGKTNQNYSADQDQVLELVSIQIDGIVVPSYILDKHSQFEFDDQIHLGSRYFGPNGTWTWNFATPVITYILDQKINHEAQYNQDYQYPWAYKLGPNSVNTILSNIEQAMSRVQRL